MLKFLLHEKGSSMSIYAVTDTNVLVSAFLKETSVPRFVMEYVFAGNVVLLYNEEILAEYKKVFFDQVNEFLSSKSLPRLDIQLLENNIFLTSAGTYYGVGELLRKFAELIKKTESSYDFELFHQDYSELQEEEDEESELITEITKEEKPMLIEEGYINELESRFSKVRYIQNREITKMVFTIPRGNDEAESYFRAQMQSRGFIQLLEDEGMMRGDVLRIKSYYEGVDDKYILY